MHREVDQRVEDAAWDAYDHAVDHPRADPDTQIGRLRHPESRLPERRLAEGRGRLAVARLARLSELLLPVGILRLPIGLSGARLPKLLLSVRILGRALRVRLAGLTWLAVGLLLAGLTRLAVGLLLSVLLPGRIGLPVLRLPRLPVRLWPGL
ncbi:hypothetical protein [Nocardia albiluteola]|uniref:hypothetical protein n=1 Tax=Nocardia albiluteola TaxID=2842303 RepID=UPI001FDA1516|nr:hypothetical protein [Nocardia albiluteola]